MRALLILLAVLLATEAGAVEVLSLVRDVAYTGGLEEPGMMGDARSSVELGSFSEALEDVLSSPPDAEASAQVSQFSYVSADVGGLFIAVDADAGTHATTLADGTIADALAESRLEIVFTTDETTQLTVDIVASSGLGLFYDGPGVGEVASSYVASFLLCVVGGGCLADILAEDTTDNGQAVAIGISDSIQIPPGDYEVQLIAISQSISRDVGSTLGSAGVSGEITVEPLPEPGQWLMLAAGIAFLATRRRVHSRYRSAPEWLSSSPSRICSNSHR